MPQTATRSKPPANRLLATLPRKEYQQLLARLEQTNLSFGSSVYEPGETIRYVYFPTSGIISLLATEGNGSNLEVGIVGREGVVGAMAGFGLQRSMVRAVVQLPMTASKIAECPCSWRPTLGFQNIFIKSPGFAAFHEVKFVPRSNSRNRQAVPGPFAFHRPQTPTPSG